MAAAEIEQIEILMEQPRADKLAAARALARKIDRQGLSYSTPDSYQNLSRQTFLSITGETLQTCLRLAGLGRVRSREKLVF
jgi:hypothetical protein